MPFLVLSEYKEGSGYIKAVINPIIIKYLENIFEGNFTSYNKHAINSLRSAHAARVYKLMKQYAKFGSRTIDIDELKSTLKVQGKYPKYADFRRRILDSVVQEINELPQSEISLKYDEIKTGRAVTTIKFLITVNPIAQALPLAPA